MKKIKYKHKWSFNYNFTYYLTHPWEIFDELYREVKYFLQRGWRGYADCDIWNFDHYLSRLLADGLKILASGNSYPGQKKFDTAKKWEDALKLNSKRFQDYIDYEETGWEDDEDFSKLKKVYKEREKAIKFVGKWFGNLWD